MAHGRKDERRDRKQQGTTSPPSPDQGLAQRPVAPAGGAARPATPLSTDDGAAELRTLRAAIEETRRELNARLDLLAAAVDRLLPASAAPSAAQASASHPVAKPRPDLRPGDDVYVPRLGGAYTVVEAPATGNTLKVQAGPMRVELRYDEVWPLDETPTPAPPVAGTSGHTPSPMRPNPDPAIPSIDLHGYSEANATITLELFLNHEYARHTPRVRVIHGKGNGILRDAVRRELRASALVRAIDTGPHFHGDDGVTLADLDL